MRTFRPDLPLCPEALNCSKLHPFERLSSMSERRSVFDQPWDFFSKNTDMERQLQSSKQCVFPSGRAHS